MPDDAPTAAPIVSPTGALCWPLKNYRGLVMLHRSHALPISLNVIGAGYDFRVDLTAERTAEIRDCLTAALDALAGSGA